MNSTQPAMDENYIRYVRLLVQHEKLIPGGKAEGEEAADLEEEMIHVWDQLDFVQKQSLSGLVSDLNWVRRDGEPAPRGPREEEVSQEDKAALIEAERNSNWHEVLSMLRACSPVLPPFQLARLRAEAWTGLGQPAIAGVFYEFAARLEPSNGSIGQEDLSRR